MQANLKSNSTRPVTVAGRTVRAEKKFDIKIHRDESAFDDLREEWEHLSARCDATVCSSPDWVRAWWDHFGKNPNRSLCIVTVRLQGHLAGLAPMYIGRTRIGPIATELRLQMIGSGGSPNETLGYPEDYGISDFLDILVDPDYKDELAKLFCDWFMENPSGADRITFHQAREESFIVVNLVEEFRKREIDLQMEVTDLCPRIELEGVQDLDDFIRRAKSNARRRFRQTLRAMKEEQVYTVVPAESPAEIERAVQTVIELHQSRWNSLGFPGVFHDKRFVGFFRQIVRDAAREGRLWFREAADEQGVSASRMILRYNGRFYDYISGFDDRSQSARSRPGIGILLSLIEDAIAQNIHRIELLRGEEDYKFDFTARTVANYRIELTPENNRAAMRQRMHGLLHPAALLYTSASKEMRLLRVQKSRNGILRSIPNYLRFRIGSLKRKFGK